MLSTFPATLSSESFLGNLFPPFEAVFPTWEYHELWSLFPPQEEPAVFSPQFYKESVSPNSGSDAHNPALSSGSDGPGPNESKTLSSGSDEPTGDNLKNKSSGSDDTSRLGCITDERERKRKRMISNRESARRSRMRKQKHLENLRNQASRLKVGNREQMNRLRLIVHQTQLFRQQNECLWAEAVMLRQRLWDIRQVLVVRQLQQLYPTAMH